MESIVSLISSVGFPIVACIFLWRYLSTTLKELTDALNQNTRMCERIYEKLGGILDEDNSSDTH